MTVTELGLHSPWLRIARQRVYPLQRDSAWGDSKGVAAFGRTVLRGTYRGPTHGNSNHCLEGSATPRQWVTLHVNGKPDACAYASLTDAVASLARRPVGFTYEIFRGGRRVFRFGVALAGGTN